MYPSPHEMHHRVYVVDFERELLGMLSVIADVTEEGQLFSEKDVLMSALNYLHHSRNLNEAIEAMHIDIQQFCRYQKTYYRPEQMQEIDNRIRIAISIYLNSMYHRFNELRLYKNKQLTYTFGGWHAEYIAVLVPMTHLSLYPNGVDCVVSGEPYDPHPSQVYTPQRITHPYYEPASWTPQVMGHHVSPEFLVPY